MSLYGQRGSFKGWTRRGSSCLLCLLLVSVSWIVFRIQFATHMTPQTGVRATVDSEVIDCRPANLSVAVSLGAVNTLIKLTVIPKILADNNTLIVPEQDLGHLWLGVMKVRHFKLDSLNVSTGGPRGQDVVLQATGLILEVEESQFIFHYMGLECSGTFWSTLSDTSVDAVLSLKLLPQGRWNVTFPRFEVGYGQLQVHHTLNSKACSIAQKVVEVFTGQLDVFVAEKVKEQLNEEAPSRVAEKLNEAFLRFTIHAITPPVMTGGTMAVTLDLNPGDLGCASVPIASTVPDTLPRNIGMRTTVTSLNNFLYNAVQAQRLRVERHLPAEWNTSLFEDVIPVLYKVCPDCFMSTLVQAAVAPTLHVPLDGEVSVTAENVIVGLYVQPKTTQQAGALSLMVAGKKSRSSAGFEDVYRSFGIKPLFSQDDSKPFPVLAIRCSVAFGVRNISADTGRSVSYEILPLHDVAVEVEASNVGDVDAKELEDVITKVWNDFAAPMANSDSPLRLPTSLERAVLLLGSEDIEAGVDVVLQTEFLKAIFSL
ncbi:hypothetical protein CUR178_01691 [Leishmania enriettii]|uniref:Expression site-associated gene 5 (ESAG5) protein n=1 Tax=Leishmania enriettii TaxID=5663 RepID=A0A836GNJ8_LEIEN|nr:hypothetical protein CUR178_01691 [Leishmania enriettii]